MDIKIYTNVLTMTSMMVNLMRQLKLNLEFVEIVYYLIFLNRSNYQGRMCHLDEDWFECNLLRDCIIHEVV
jgi:hypothetical protein